MWSRRLFAFFAALALVIAACGGDTGETADTTGDTNASTTTDMVSTTAADEETLDPDAMAIHGESDLEVGFSPDPLTVDVTSGGDLSASDLVGCEGFVATAPDYEVDWDGSGFLRVFYEPDTEADTTLIVNGPNDEWTCEDDSFGTMDPMIDFTDPEAGEYDIWVGTTSGETVEGELTITDGGDALPDGATTTTSSTAPGSSTTATTTAGSTTTDAPTTTSGSIDTIPTTSTTFITTTSTTLGTTTTSPSGTTFTIPSTTIPNITTTIPITIPTTTTTTFGITSTTFTIPPTTIPGITTTTFDFPFP